eukprot:TRINITY_DN15721_c2_g1_i1.p1 TRINITY_DN15721_c2_g1~~TRINITY_DN15721_c2_g1_i1.p1  ORF type:complete len:518 (+),score=81.83 TRINITY_DN15721_c2_g1_i1:61-1614(+)
MIEGGSQVHPCCPLVCVAVAAEGAIASYNPHATFLWLTPLSLNHLGVTFNNMPEFHLGLGQQTPGIGFGGTQLGNAQSMHFAAGQTEFDTSHEAPMQLFMDEIAMQETAGSNLWSAQEADVVQESAISIGEPEQFLNESDALRPGQQWGEPGMWPQASDNADEPTPGRSSLDAPTSSFEPSSPLPAAGRNVVRRRRGGRQRCSAGSGSSPAVSHTHGKKSVLRDTAAVEASGEIQEDAVFVVGGLDATRAREFADALLNQLKVGGRVQRSAAARIIRQSFADKAASYAVQLALQEAQGSDAVVLASALHGHVLEACRSMHANYVVQKIVEVLPPSNVSFVAQELYGFGVEIARNRFGCRILCRLLEYGSFADAALTSLVSEIVEDSGSLSRHTYGNYVIRHCLEFVPPANRRRISDVLLADLFGIARHRYGSRVVQAALQLCDQDEQNAIASKLVGNPEEFTMLAKSLSGRYVVKSLLRMPLESAQKAHHVLQQASSQLQTSKYGKSVLESLDCASV